MTKVETVQGKQLFKGTDDEESKQIVSIEDDQVTLEVTLQSKKTVNITLPEEFELKREFKVNDFIRLRSVFYTTIHKQTFKSPRQSKSARNLMPSKQQSTSNFEVSPTQFFNALRVPTHFRSAQILAMSFIIDPKQKKIKPHTILNNILDAPNQKGLLAHPIIVSQVKLASTNIKPTLNFNYLAE